MKEDESLDNKIAIRTGEAGDSRAQIWRILIPLLVAAVVYLGLPQIPILLRADYFAPQVLLIKLEILNQELTWKKTHAEIKEFEAERLKDSIMLYGTWVRGVIGDCRKIIVGMVFFAMLYFFSWRPNVFPDQPDWSISRAFVYTVIFLLLSSAIQWCLVLWLGEGYWANSQIKLWKFTAFGIWLQFFSGVISAPLIEEFYFRWGLQRVFLALGLGRWGAVSCQAILFGVVHYNSHNSIGMFIATAIGFFLGVIYLKTQKIWIPILLHAVVNAMAMSEQLFGY